MIFKVIGIRSVSVTLSYSYGNDYSENGLSNGKGFLERFGVSKSLDGTIDVSPLET